MLHPRGRDGRFIKKFGRIIVKTPFGKSFAGDVEELNVDGRGGIMVRKDDGTLEKVRKNWVQRSVKSKARLGARKPEDDADLPDNTDDLLREVADQYPDKPGGNEPNKRHAAKVNKSLKLALESDDPIYRMGKIEDAILGARMAGDKDVAARLERALDREEDRYNASIEGNDEEEIDAPEPKEDGEKARLDAPEPKTPQRSPGSIAKRKQYENERRRLAPDAPRITNQILPGTVLDEKIDKTRPGRAPEKLFDNVEDVPYTHTDDDAAKSAKPGQYAWYANPQGEGFPVRITSVGSDGKASMRAVTTGSPRQPVVRPMKYLQARPPGSDAPRTQPEVGRNVSYPPVEKTKTKKYDTESFKKADIDGVAFSYKPQPNWRDSYISLVLVNGEYYRVNSNRESSSPDKAKKAAQGRVGQIQRLLRDKASVTTRPDGSIVISNGPAPQSTAVLQPFDPELGEWTPGAIVAAGYAVEYIVV